MSDEDPVRLKDQRAASPELVRALRALGTSSDAARLERVSQKLGAALADAQPMAASGAGLLGGKALIVALVAAGIAALAWLGSSARTPLPERSAPPPELHAAPPPPPPTAADDNSVSPPALEPAPPASAPVKLSNRHGSLRSRAPSGGEPRASMGMGAAVSGAHGTRGTHSAHGARGSSEDAQSTQDATQDARDTTRDATAALAPPPPPADDAAHKPAAPQPSAAEPAPPQPSEAALLFGARKAMPSQPSAALKLLEQHAARFPDGLLAPEREVLRIEALRRLGRTAEADQRLRAFQVRYPDSIHLRRLQKAEGDKAH